MLSLRRIYKIFFWCLLAASCVHAQNQVEWILKDALDATRMPLFRPSIIDPDDVKRAYGLYEAGEYERAAELLSKLRDTQLPDGSLDFVTFILAETRRMQKQKNAAVAQYEYVVRRFPKSDKIAPALFRLLQYAALDRNTPFVDTVISTFRSKYQTHPLYSAVLLTAARAYFHDRRYAEAAEICNQIQRGSLHHFPAQFLGALCQSQLKDFIKTMVLLEYVRKGSPDEALASEASIVMGDLYYGRDSVSTALRYYLGISPSAKRYIYATVKAGWVYYTRKEYQKTRDLVVDALTRKDAPDYYFELMSLLELTYSRMNDREKAATVNNLVYRHVVQARMSQDILDELSRVGDLKSRYNALALAFKSYKLPEVDRALRDSVVRCMSLERQYFGILHKLKYAAGSMPDTAHEKTELAVRRYINMRKNQQKSIDDSVLMLQALVDTLIVRRVARNNASDTLLMAAIAYAEKNRDSLKVSLGRIDADIAAVKQAWGSSSGFNEDATPIKYIDWAFMKYQSRMADLAELNRDLAKKKQRKQGDSTTLGASSVVTIFSGIDRDKLHLEIMSEREALISYVNNMLEFAPQSRYNPQILFRLAELNYDDAADNFDKRLREYEQRLATATDTSALVFPEYTLEKNVAVYNKIIQDYPRSELADRAYFYKALSQQKVGMYDSSNVTLQELVKKYPESSFFVEANMNIGRYYFDHPQIEGKKGYKRAEEAFREVLYYRDHPQFVQALYNLGWCYYMQDQYSEAIAVFKYLVEEVQLNFDPTKMNENQAINPLLRGEAIDYIAISFDEEGKIDEAVKFLALIGSPDYAAMVLKRMAELREEVQDYGMAVKMYERLLKEYPQSTIAPAAVTGIIKIQESQKKSDLSLAQREQFLQKYGRGSAWQKSMADRDSSLIVMADSMAIANGLYVADEAYRTAQETKDAKLYEKAVATYRTVVALYPEHPRALTARWNLAVILDQKLNRLQDAYLEYVRFSTLYGADSAQREQAALNAIAIAQKLITPDSVALPGDSSALSFLAASNGYLAHFPRGLQVNKVQSAVAAYYFNHTKFADAIGIYRQIIAREPTSTLGITSMFLIGQSYFGLEEWEQSAAAFKVVSLQSPDALQRGEAHKLLLQSEYLRAKQMYAAGKYYEAAQAFVGIEDRFPQSEYGDVVLFNAADAWEKLDSLSKACDAYLRLFKGYSESKLAPGGLFNAASDYEKLNNWEAAARTYEQLISWYPLTDKVKDALFNVGFCYEKLGQLDKMAGANDRYTTRYPGEKDANAMMLRSAQFYVKAAMFDKAKNVYTNFLKRFPADAKTVEAYFMLGKIAFQQGDRSAAKSFFIQAEKQHEQFTLAQQAGDRFYASEAAYYLADMDREVFTSVKFTGGKKLKEEQSAKTDLMAQATKSYTRVVQYQSERMFEAAFRIGEMYETYARDWQQQKLDESDPIKLAVVGKDIKQAASVLMQKSLTPFKKVIELSAGFDSLKSEQKGWISQSRGRIAGNYLEGGRLQVAAIDIMYEAPLPREIAQEPLHFFQYEKQLSETMEGFKLKARDYFSVALQDMHALNFAGKELDTCLDLLAYVNFRMGNDFDNLAQRIIKNDFQKKPNISAEDEDELNFQLEDILFELQDKAIFGYEDGLTMCRQNRAQNTAWYGKILQNLARLSPETYGKSFYVTAYIPSDQSFKIRQDSVQNWTQSTGVDVTGWNSVARSSNDNGVSYDGINAQVVWSSLTDAGQFFVRKDVLLNGTPRSGILRYAVNGRFRLYVNGVYTTGDTNQLRTVSRADSLTNMATLLKGGDNVISLSADPGNNRGGVSLILKVLLDTTQHFSSSLGAFTQAPTVVKAPIAVIDKGGIAQSDSTALSPMAVVAQEKAPALPAGKPVFEKVLAQLPLSMNKPPLTPAEQAKEDTRKQIMNTYKNRGSLIAAIDDYAKRSQVTEVEIRRERVGLQKLGIQNEYYATKIRTAQSSLDSLNGILEAKGRGK